MKRVDGDGATVDNLFTNGNPSLGIPATTVDDNWLNSIQEELALFIEAQGITLDQTGTDLTQFQQALNNFSVGGGVGIPNFSVNNEVTVAEDVTGLSFNSSTEKAARILFELTRRTDTQNVIEMGEMFVSFDSESNQWKLTLASYFDDAGVTFSIATTDQGGPGPYVGQVQLLSTNLTGGNYSGTLRLKNIVKVAN